MPVTTRSKKKTSLRTRLANRPYYNPRTKRPKPKCKQSVEVPTCSEINIPNKQVLLNKSDLLFCDECYKEVVNSFVFTDCLEPVCDSCSELTSLIVDKDFEEYVPEETTHLTTTKKERDDNFQKSFLILGQAIFQHYNPQTLRRIKALCVGIDKFVTENPTCGESKINEVRRHLCSFLKDQKSGLFFCKECDKEVVKPFVFAKSAEPVCDSCNELNSLIEAKDFEEYVPEEPTRLTITKNERTNKNCQKALIIRQARLASRPYCNPHTHGSLAMYNQSDACTGVPAYGEDKLADNQAALHQSDLIFCKECDKELGDSYVFTNLRERVCDTCHELTSMIVAKANEAPPVSVDVDFCRECTREMPHSYVFNKPLCDACSDLSMIIEEKTNEVSWDNMPHVILLRIYRLLSYDDRISLSLTCRQWAELLKEKALWTSAYFKFSLDDMEDESWVARNYFDSNFMKHLKELTIECETDVASHTSESACSYAILLRNWIGVLKKFCKKLQVQSFTVIDLQFSSFESNRWNEFASCLGRFLLLQKDLRTFSMRTALFQSQIGMVLLRTLAAKCGRTLESVDLVDFMYPDRDSNDRSLAWFYHPFHIETMKKFTKLRHIATDYRTLGDEILENFAVNLRDTLSSMEIFVDCHEPVDHTINSPAWLLLKEACPKLKVSVRTTAGVNMSIIQTCLNPDMPIKDLCVGLHSSRDMDITMDAVLAHVADTCGDTLEYFMLLGHYRSVDEGGIVKFVKKCEKLRRMYTDGINISSETVDQLRTLD